jgi:hypothetical protein
MIRTDTTTLSHHASAEVNRLRLVLGMVEAAGFTPCFKTSFASNGVAFAFSEEMAGFGTERNPAHSVTLHADGRVAIGSKAPTRGIHDRAYLWQIARSLAHPRNVGGGGAKR